MSNINRIIKVKKQWYEAGFIGGVILCDFLFMRERGMDIVDEDEFVKEYQNLLKQRLQTESLSLILMVNTEIEKCYIDKEENVYEYLGDEIYEHFENNNKRYPLEAVGLHIDIMVALIYLNEKERVYNYLHTMKETYKETFGEKSYLFCRNWCYILNEVLLEFIPQIANREFEDNKDLFSVILREDEILYSLCINIAIKRTNQEQNAIYLKDATELCKKWYKGTLIGKRERMQSLIRSTEAMYYRNVGEYDIAIKLFGEVMELTDDIHFKRFLLAQIASILYVKNDSNQLGKLLEKNEHLFRLLDELDENIAELYNLYGSYYMLIGNWKEAKIQINKAIEISEQVVGKEADITLKFKCTKLLAEYNSGEFDKSREQMLELLNIVYENVENYSESLPLLLNNIISMSLEDNISNAMVRKMRNVLQRQNIKYDIPSNIMFKCNLYCIMMASGMSFEEDEPVETLRKELDDYFKKYPYTVGYLVYLRGEFYRLSRKNSFLGYSVLEKIEDYFIRTNINSISKEYVLFFIIKLKKYIYTKSYISAKKWLLSVWNIAIVPLFKTLINKSEENSEGNYLLLHTYISLFISAARQYPQLKITDKEMYEFILNFKYLEDLFYCNKKQFRLELEKEKWLSIESISLTQEKLIIECFFYGKYNLEGLELFDIINQKNSSELYQIYFAIEVIHGFFKKPIVNVIGEISWEEFSKTIIDIFEIKKISFLETRIWNALKKFISKKEQIYVCDDSLILPITLGVMRINENEYYSDRYQIIYCNTGNDVKDDIRISDFSNSIYFGMSVFKENKKENAPKMQMTFCNLPYTELEIKKLSILTHGKTYLDKSLKGEDFHKINKEIIHFATHTMESNGEKALVIGQENNGDYIILKSTDIAKLDWTEVKLVVFSACETGEEPWKKVGRHSLRQAARKAGVRCTISTVVEVDDAINAFFMVCFYKNLLIFKQISRAFFETQKMMRTITKKEILLDDDYLAIGMRSYLQDYEDNINPFEDIDSWGVYILHMN